MPDPEPVPGPPPPVDPAAPPAPPSAPSPTSPDPRRAAVERATNAWIDQLIDVGAGNRLLYYRDLQVGTLDLDPPASEAVVDAPDEPDAPGDASGTAPGAASVTPPPMVPPTVVPAALAALRGGRKTRLSTLVPDPAARAEAAAKLRAISAKARENFEERGIQTLFLAWGMATWTAPAGGAATPAAPVLLLPAAVTRRDAAGEDFDLDLAGDPEVNPTLVHYLATQHAVVLDPDALLGAAYPDDGSGPDGPALFAALGVAAGSLPGFEIRPRSILGNFSFAKLPMVRDLEHYPGQLLAHDVIAAIAGDVGAQTALRGNRPEIDPSAPDRTPPADEFLVLPADASQHHVINRVLAGEHVLIQGPPGTGKSQTIANLIASLMAHGRRVLFVAEKRAAIDAVVDRVERAGLGDLVLDLHRDNVSRAKVAQNLAESLRRVRESTAPDQQVLHQDLTRERDALVAHEHTMNDRREPWGVSLYEVQAELLGLPTSARSTLRFGPASLPRLDPATLAARTADLREYVGLGAPSLTATGSPWAAAVVRTPEEAQRALQWAEYLTQVLVTLPPHLDALTRETGLVAPTTPAGWRERLAFLHDVQSTLLLLTEAVFAPTADLDALVRDLEPAAHGAGVVTSVFSGTFRRAKKRAVTFCRTDPGDDLAPVHAALVRARGQRDRWIADRVDDGVPHVPPSIVSADQAFAAYADAVTALAAFLPGTTTDDAPLPDTAAWAASLVADQATLYRLPRLRAIEAGFAEAGAGGMLDLAARSSFDPDTAAQALRYAWLASVNDAIAPIELGAFDGPVHTAREQAYRDLDREHLAATVARVSRAVAERVTEVRNHYPDQSQLVENQAGRKRGHLPVRQFFAQAPDVLTALKPCWTMSPLLVAQLLPGDRPYFDVVVFDEASQVTPADAVPAILRGAQLVVAGDSRQLPPTAFFVTDTVADRAELDDEDLVDGSGAPAGLDLGLTSGYESVLDVVGALFRPGYLTWHYRSRDERLISFSNEYIYDGMLTTFPGVGAGSCISHELVVAGADDPGPDGSVTAEVRRVVELVVQHARTRPDESLGVITMGIKHAARIEEAVRRAVADTPDVAAFFREDTTERFFVKNLERVQGDERDAIILSIGYGKTPDGRLPYRFGPLLLDGGERRLNVAVTRARSQITVVSSFSHLDMDPNRSSAPGVVMLRAYLEFAASGGATLAAVRDSTPDLDPFEVYVRDWLTAAGVPVVAQYGVSGYRLDFAASHPRQPGRMVLAIECDGASYHSGATARDRDRLRQEVLENLGWRFHRVWSTDFFRDPHAATQRAVEAWQQAVAAADAADQRLAERTAAVAAATPGPVAGPDASDGPAPDLGPAPVQGSDPGAGRIGPCPVPGDGRAISTYRDTELDALIRWIQSDTRLRTDRELLDEAVRELGFSRHGPRIVERLDAAIERVRAAG